MFVQQQADELIKAVMYVKEHLADKVETLAAEVVKAFKNGHKVILMGNGGSASDAQHIAAEFVGRFKKELPFWLDTIGTGLTACVYGPLYGGITGICSNL